MNGFSKNARYSAEVYDMQSHFRWERAYRMNILKLSEFMNH